MSIENPMENLKNNILKGPKKPPENKSENHEVDEKEPFVQQWVEESTTKKGENIIRVTTGTGEITENPLDNKEKSFIFDTLPIEMQGRLINDAKKKLIERGCSANTIEEEAKNLVEEMAKGEIEKGLFIKTEKTKENKKKISDADIEEIYEKYKKIQNEDVTKEEETSVDKMGYFMTLKRQIGIVEDVIKKNEDPYIVEDAKKRLPKMEEEYNKFFKEATGDMIDRKGRNGAKTFVEISEEDYKKRSLK